MFSHNIVLIGGWPPPSGGVASHLQDLYYNLRDKTSYKIIVYGSGNFKEELPDIKKLFSRQDHVLLNCFHLTKFLLEVSPHSIIHSHSFLTAHPSLIKLYLSLFLIKVKKCIWLETIHDETLITRYQSFSIRQRNIYSRINAHINKLIVISPNLESFFLSIGFSKNKIELINPLLPIDYLQNKISLITECKSFIQHKKYIITTSGAFIKDYDIDTIIQAFLNVKNLIPDIGLIILNTSFNNDEEYTKLIKILIKRAPNDIKIFQDLPRGETLAIYKETSIFIRGAKVDAFGLSKVEALLMGAEVVSTKAGIIKFMHLYEYQNVNSLSCAMLQILQGHKKINNSQNYYRKLAADNFRSIINIYKDLINNKSK